MTIMSPDTEAKLRMFFKWLNHFMVFWWRLGLGSWGNRAELTGQIMVLTHHGRRSGLLRYTPVNYTIHNGDIYCVAGFGAISDWYKNVLADPQVEVWLPSGWWSGIAQDVTGCEEHLVLLRQVLIASGFAARMAGIDPHYLSDNKLAAITAKYRLLRIRRGVPRTGPGGPGDLSWIWPLATMILFPLAIWRRNIPSREPMTSSRKRKSA